MEVKGFRVACGGFVGVSDVDKGLLEKPGTALVPHGVLYAEGMFAARGFGPSMQPKIPDGAWLVFHPDVVGTRQDRYVLVVDQGEIGGDRYTLKKYHSHKIYWPEDRWEHDRIQLLSLNPEYAPITLENNGNYLILGWYVGHVLQIERVEPIQYPVATET
jgi:phage repressor protein C with HTH and peptisase S24 domain